LKIDMGILENVVRAKKPKRLPVVLNRTEVLKVLDGINGTLRLVVSLLYGAGMRLLDGLRLRVQDVDFESGELLIRHGKGGKDRRTMLPESFG
jgi:integrase